VPFNILSFMRSWFQGVLLYSSLVIVSWGRMRGDQRRRPTRTKMSLATDSNAAAATKPLMKKLRGVQLLHNGCQQELDAAAMYSRCGSKQKRTQNSKSEDLKLEEGRPFAAVKKTKDHCNNNSCGTTRTMTMTPLRSYWEDKTNWVGGILSVIDDMRWSKHMCMPKGDRSVWETIANVATSIPFVVIGINTPRYDYNPLAVFKFLILFFLIHFSYFTITISALLQLLVVPIRCQYYLKLP
jgi:hypothetical protein